LYVLYSLTPTRTSWVAGCYRAEHGMAHCSTRRTHRPWNSVVQLTLALLATEYLRLYRVVTRSPPVAETHQQTIFSTFQLPSEC